LAASGCNGNNVGGNATDDGGVNGDSGGGGGGGGGGDGGNAYCQGSGPPIVVSDSGGTATRCSGQVAATAFRYALCSCSGLSSGSPITTDAFDSTMPGATTFGTGGSVGVNSDINVSNTLSVGGSLQIAGGATLNKLVVGVDALLNSTLHVEQAITVHRNAEVNGDVQCNGPAQSMTVTGTLTYPSNRTLQATSPVIGNKVLAPVSVAAPCDCGANLLFDIAGYVTARQTDNDNASIGLDPNLLNNFMGDQTLNLSCGRFYMGRIGGNGKLTINVSGHTALFIDGDVNLNSSFNVVLGPSGELDLFINGGLTDSGPFNFGDTTTPARVRLYMGGSRNVNLAPGSVIGGNLYAPQSALVTRGDLTVYGALFVNSFNPSGPVTIHHDIAVLKAGDECSPTMSGTGNTGSGGGTGGTNGGCQRCQDCGGQACTGGQCGACTTDADCCSPLYCSKGKCIYVLG
jgi:hypothetical protein